MNVSQQNLEDAANIASEFIYSLDNLPHEVGHYLEEIRYKDARAQDLQQQIDIDNARWIRHTLRDSGNSIGYSPSPSPSPSARSVSHLQAKIQSSYAEIEQLSNEKINLAQRIVELVTRTRHRLDTDLNKIRVLQGDAPSSDYFSPRSLPLTIPSFTTPATVGISGQDPVTTLNDSLKLALAPNPSVALHSEIRRSTTATASISAAIKKRPGRSGYSPSIKLPATKTRSASPAGPVNTKPMQSRSSGLSRQVHLPVEEIELGDDDADADEDLDDADDDKLYCFCQTSSYGDMIACDNEGACPYEWFHLSCVGLSKPLPDKWYCSVCEGKVAAASTSSTGRKGRKK